MREQVLIYGVYILGTKLNIQQYIKKWISSV